MLEMSPNLTQGSIDTDTDTEDYLCRTIESEQDIEDESESIDLFSSFNGSPKDFPKQSNLTEMMSKQMSQPQVKVAVEGETKKCLPRPRPTNLSYLSVQGEFPLVCKTIGQLVDDAAVKFRDKTCLYVATEGRGYTFSELKLQIDQFAGGLLKLGLKPKDRIGIWVPPKSSTSRRERSNWAKLPPMVRGRESGSQSWIDFCKDFLEFVENYNKVFMNPAYQTRELFYSLNKVGMKGILIAGIFRTQNYYKLLMESVPELAYAEAGNLKSNKVPSLTTVITMEDEPPSAGVLTYNQVLNEGKSKEMIDKLDQMAQWIEPNDICNIQFTSGTTGNPKGVMLTHHNVVNNSFLIGKRLCMTSEDKICLTVPMFHCFGSVIGAMTALHYGASIVYPSTGFVAAAALKVASEQKCTLMYGTPTMHVDMINDSNITKFDLSNLRSAVTAGAICPSELCKKMKEIYGISGVDSLYGLTEASPIFFQSLSDDDDNLREMTVGYPSEHVEIKLVNREGRIVPTGTPGEMCVRGYNVMPGYWDDKEKTMEVIDSARWFHTGDLFVLTETGHAKVVGRLKDMMIRGGENIYPREIEDFLLTHPSIVDAQVFGVPDERLGENVAVWIRLKDDVQMSVEDVQNYCKGQISHFKIPKYVKFTSVFPKTQSGKVKKFIMRQQMTAELGL